MAAPALEIRIWQIDKLVPPWPDYGTPRRAIYDEWNANGGFE
jgi:hypothetical protein